MNKELEDKVRAFMKKYDFIGFHIEQPGNELIMETDNPRCDENEPWSVREFTAGSPTRVEWESLQDEISNYLKDVEG